MSNHSGSYMLNEVLYVAQDMGILKSIGKEKSIEFAKKLISIGNGYDCNNYEILDGIGEKIGICYRCLQELEDSQYELCKSCCGYEEE